MTRDTGGGMGKRNKRNRQGATRVIVGTILLALAGVGSYVFVEDGRSAAGSSGAAPTSTPEGAVDAADQPIAETANSYLAELDRLGPCGSSDLGSWTAQTLGVQGETVFVALAEVATTLPVVRRGLPAPACHVAIVIGEDVAAWEVQDAGGQPLARTASLLNAPNGGVVEGVDELEQQQLDSYVQISLASGQPFAGTAEPALVQGASIINGLEARVVFEPFGPFAEQVAALTPEGRVIALQTSGIDPNGQLGPVIPLPSGWAACTASLARTGAGFVAVGTVEACSGATRVEVSLVESPPEGLPAGAVAVGAVVVVPLVGEPEDLQGLAAEIDDALEVDITGQG